MICFISVGGSTVLYFSFFKFSGFPDFRFSGIRESGGTGLLEFWVSGKRVFRFSGFTKGWFCCNEVDELLSKTGVLAEGAGGGAGFAFFSNFIDV